MEKRIKDRFNQGILQEAQQRFGILPENIKLLDGFESFMFEFTREEAGGVIGEYILRLGHSLRRSTAMIEGEVDWINTLARGGAGVARAIYSSNGNLVELIPDGQGEYFLATSFVKARGHAPRRNDWTPGFYAAYGRLLGRIHAISRTYQPANPAFRRPDWDDPINIQLDQYLPPSEEGAARRFKAVIAYLQTLPCDPEGYGMIHQDAHGGNLFVDDTGQITLFDFDDCCYGHFIYDLAMVLFYALTMQPDPESFAAQFLPVFLQGYRQENYLDPKWLAQMPHFLKLRELDLYALIHRSFDVEHIDDPWVKWFMDGRKQRIEQDQPVLNFDFMSLAPYLS